MVGLMKSISDAKSALSCIPSIRKRQLEENITNFDQLFTNKHTCQKNQPAYFGTSMSFMMKSSARGSLDLSPSKDFNISISSGSGNLAGTVTLLANPIMLPFISKLARVWNSQKDTSLQHPFSVVPYVTNRGRLRPARGALSLYKIPLLSKKPTWKTKVYN